MRLERKTDNRGLVKKIIPIVIGGILTVILAISVTKLVSGEKKKEEAAAEYKKISEEYAGEEPESTVNGIHLMNNGTFDNSDVGREFDITDDDRVWDTVRPAPVPEPDHDSLKEQNSDYVCWLYIPGTSISYPVVSRDDSYYTEHTFSGAENPSGSIFVGRSSNKITYIYGHNMSDGTMFGLLKRVKDSNAEEIWLIFPEETKKFKIISGHVTMVGGDVYTEPEDVEGLKKFIDKQQRSSEKQYKGVDYGTYPNILVLSTCYGMPGGTGRYVLCAVK